MTKQEKEMGFRSTDKGIIYLNSNAFARYIHKKYKIICASNGKFYRYHNGVYKEISEDRLKALMARIILQTSFPDAFNKKAEEFYFTALKRIAFYNGKFNKYKNLICLKNGVFDIESKKFLPHSEKYRFTVQFPIIYDENAKCPVFEAFLVSVFKNNKKLIAIAQEILGYIFTQSTSAQCFFIFYGTGANGKSVLANLIIALVGKNNFASISIRDLKNSFSRAALKDITVNISTENEAANGALLDSQYIKAISSGDAIKAEFKGKDAFTFKPYCKLIFCTNTLPQFADKSDGFFRRVMIIPFEQYFSIKDGTADIYIEEKLKSELSGVFNFAIEGLERLSKNNYVFTQSKKVNRLKSSYKKLVNPYEAFWTERIVIKEELEMFLPTKEEIYSSFIEWCKENNHNGYANTTPRRFWLEFNSIAMQKLHKKLTFKKSGNDRFVRDIQLKNKLFRPKPKFAITKKFTIDTTYDETTDDDDDEI